MVLTNTWNYLMDKRSDNKPRHLDGRNRYNSDWLDHSNIPQDMVQAREIPSDSNTLQDKVLPIWPHRKSNQEDKQRAQFFQEGSRCHWDTRIHRNYCWRADKSAQQGRDGSRICCELLWCHGMFHLDKGWDCS